jgi:hypothetical protein
LSGIIDDLTAQPFSELQAKSIRLSHTYRKITAKYAESVHGIICSVKLKAILICDMRFRDGSKQ